MSVALTYYLARQCQARPFCRKCVNNFKISDCSSRCEDGPTNICLTPKIAGDHGICEFCGDTQLAPRYITTIEFQEGYSAVAPTLETHIVTYYGNRAIPGSTPFWWESQGVLGKNCSSQMFFYDPFLDELSTNLDDCIEHYGVISPGVTRVLSLSLSGTRAYLDYTGSNISCTAANENVEMHSNEYINVDPWCNQVLTFTENVLTGLPSKFRVILTPIPASLP